MQMCNSKNSFVPILALVAILVDGEQSFELLVWWRAFWGIFVFNYLNLEQQFRKYVALKNLKFKLW